MYDWTTILGRHGDGASEHRQAAAVPIFLQFVKRGEACVDESRQIGTDRFAAVSVGNAEIADRVLDEAVKAGAEGLLVDLLSHRQQPVRSIGTFERARGHVLSPPDRGSALDNVEMDLHHLAMARRSLPIPPNSLFRTIDVLAFPDVQLLDLAGRDPHPGADVPLTVAANSPLRCLLL